MASAAGVVGVPDAWTDTLGPWSPTPGQGYIQSARKRIELMQQMVAQAIRTRNDDADFLDEAEASEKVEAALLAADASASEASAQVEQLRYFNAKTLEPLELHESWPG